MTKGNNNSQERPDKGLCEIYGSNKHSIEQHTDKFMLAEKDINSLINSLIKEINKLRAQRDYWEKKYKKLEEKDYGIKEVIRNGRKNNLGIFKGNRSSFANTTNKVREKE